MVRYSPLAFMQRTLTLQPRLAPELGSTILQRSAPSVILKAVKSVKFAYTPTQLTRELLETFREMVNEAVRICLKEGITGRLRLRDRVYREFQDRYGVVSCLPYSVAEVAWSMVKKHRRWERKPFARRLMMKMESQKYSLNYSILSLPFRKGERILIPLRYGDYQRSFLMDTTLKRGSVTITEEAIIITFGKEIQDVTPLSRVGVDLNEKSAVLSDGTRYDLSEVARLHTEYGVRRRDFYSRHPQDRRLKQKFAGSSRERERVRQVLHETTKKMVESAKTNGQSIVLERLRGIRYAHRRGNGEGKSRRRRIAQWPFRTLQAYITYKAAWSGVRVEFVSAAWTSQTCNQCHYLNRKLKPTERSWQCPQCGCQLDRDLNAAINIERRGKMPCLGEVRPGAQGTDEAMKGNPTTPVILRAEAPKLAREAVVLSS
jgi:putative transposase